MFSISYTYADPVSLVGLRALGCAGPQPRVPWPQEDSPMLHAVHFRRMFGIYVISGHSGARPKI